MGKRKRRVDTDGGDSPFGANPFENLSGAGLPEQPRSEQQPEAKRVESAPQRKNRGRVDVVRQRSAGGGGWMTVAKNFVGISIEEKTALKKSIQKRCGVGGSLKAGNIEIQGDKREEVKATLEAAGFRVVFAGG